MTFPILPSNSPSGIYTIDNSLRFNDNDSARLTKTFSSGNRKTWTWSAWIKRASSLGSSQSMFGCHTADTDTEQLDLTFNGSNQIQFEGKNTTFKTTSKLFRDVSAWYHIMFVLDMTQSTSDDRMKIYVNGEQETSFATDNTPAQNTDLGINQNSQHAVGMKDRNTAQFFDGYMAEVHFIDGTAKSPTDFGEFDEDSGIWKPIEYTGSYGTNGFYLDFENSGSLGADQSGNGKNFTPTNLASTDQSTDTPTNNFMTLNPLCKASIAGNPSEGNLFHIGQTSGYPQTVLGTLGWNGGGGKWYWEMKQGGASAGNYGFVRTDKPDGTNGVGNIVQTTSSTPTECIQYDWAWGVNPSNGNKRHDGSNDAYGSGLSSGDIGMVAVDTVAGKAWWGKNGTWFASGDPASGTNPAFTDTDITEGVFTIYSIVSDTDGRSKTYNFGSPPTGFTISSGNSDENGYGNFEYAPPSGFLALCTQNLATALSPTIDDGSQYFNTSLWNGNSSTQSITGVGFQPDFVWLKSRTNTASHRLNDSNRGVNKQLASNSTDAETSFTTMLTSFDSDGFTLGNNVGINGTGFTNVGWSWKCNAGTNVSNTDGSITSTVQANTTAGFSIVSYTGNRTAGATVGHGLGVAPSMVIAKCRTASAGWPVFHISLGGSNFVRLNETSASASNSVFWNNTAPSSTVVTLGGGDETNNNTGGSIMYCFAEIQGYSKFGTYTGNGNADGPFVYTGFRPAWLMIHRTDSSGENWQMFDSKRDGFNNGSSSNKMLKANVSETEDTNSTGFLDLVSNGFKIRETAARHNASGGTYIYMAFAEHPFVSSKGVPVTAR